MTLLTKFSWTHFCTPNFENLRSCITSQFFNTTRNIMTMFHMRKINAFHLIKLLAFSNIKTCTGDYTLIKRLHWWRPLIASMVSWKRCLRGLGITSFFVSFFSFCRWFKFQLLTMIKSKIVVLYILLFVGVLTLHKFQEESWKAYLSVYFCESVFF